MGHTPYNQLKRDWAGDGSHQTLPTYTSPFDPLPLVGKNGVRVSVRFIHLSPAVFLTSALGLMIYSFLRPFRHYRWRRAKDWGFNQFCTPSDTCWWQGWNGADVLSSWNCCSLQLWAALCDHLVSTPKFIGIITWKLAIWLVCSVWHSVICVTFLLLYDFGKIFFTRNMVLPNFL